MTQAIRKTAPEALAPIPFNIPNAFHTTLSNGLKVVIFEDKRFPLVSSRLAFFSGDANDPKGSTGLTSAATAMLTEGTENYSSKELAEKIERLGASISASSSEDFTIIAASALSVYQSDIFDLISEIIYRPTFPEDELDLYRRNTIENLKFQRSQPNFLANEQTARLLYGAHPYGKVSPSAADVEKLTREMLVDFHKTNFFPNNAVFIVIGDVERDEVLQEIEDKFGHSAGDEIPPATFPEPPTRDRRTLTIVDRPGSAQSNIVMANRAFARNSPDYFAALVMNQVLGAGASSRVFMNLREEKGYTYGAYTRFDSKRLDGDFEATAEVRTAVTGDSLKEFFYELERICSEAVSEQELADAKNFLTGVFPIRAETQEGLAGLILNQQIYDLPEDYLETYRDNIDAVSLEEVQQAAKKYITSDQMAIVIVGDAGEILPQATAYTDDIEIFDTDGRRRDAADYARDEAEETADFGGSWSLILDFQGQQVPVSLMLKQEGKVVSGSLETVLGNGEINAGSVRGRKLNATANTDIQGQTVEFVIGASIDGDSIAGTISASVIPDSLSFTGTRGS